MQLLPCALFLSFYFTLLLSPASSQTKKSAQDLLYEARLRPVAHPVSLYAEIRGGEEPVPLIFKIEKNQITYEFHHPNEAIVLTLEPSSSLLSDIKDGVSHVVKDQERYQEIRDTGMTYDDLSLGFLYWPHTRLAGGEMLRGINTSIIELFSPDLDATASPYRSARLWIDQHSGAPVRMEGWNQHGQLVKRFEVLSAQKIDGLWMLKEMRIETFQAEGGGVVQRRYLTLRSSN